ncbi:MAG: methylamine utilization protein [Planctomycetes bacterium]|nr:methylamine utilization protein [Planctomycetota bacterium]
MLFSCSGEIEDDEATSTTNINTSAPVFSAVAPIIVHIGDTIALNMADYFSDPQDLDITYSISGNTIDGLSINGAICSGTTHESAVCEYTIQAMNSHGARSEGTVILVVEAEESDLPLPLLPSSLDDYEAIVDNIPAHFTNDVPGFDNVSDTDNTPNDNAISNASATLGRVLFYDKRLSANNTISCASCHQQQHGFADPRALSLGFKGQETGRHAQALSNNRYYERGHFFWDERADSLEDQVLGPIQSDVEMGMTLPSLISKLEATTFYPDLFTNAYGDSAINEDRIAKALAQFVRSFISYQSEFDAVFDGAGNANYAALTSAQRRGLQLFSGKAGIAGRNLRCDACHVTTSQVSDDIHNIGLDINNNTDAGAGDGEFKAPSLRNVALRSSFMHDGRFTSLQQVIQHYSNGVQNNPQLDNRLRVRGGQVQRLNISNNEMNDLIAFLNSLSDSNSQSNPLHSDPFDPNNFPAANN